MEPSAFHQVIVVADVLAISYFLILNGFYALMLMLSLPHIWRHWETYKNDDLRQYLTTDSLPSVSIIVPSYNMEPCISDTVECLMGLHYSRYEVIVVNDGSKDGTFDRLYDTYELYEVPPVYSTTVRSKNVRAYYRSRSRPNLLVIDKVNGGKSDAQNAGIGAAQFPLLLFIDADTLVERDALIRTARTFIFQPEVAAVGATIRVANGCAIRDFEVVDRRVPKDFLAGMQVTEYLRAFFFGRLGFSSLGGNLIISGAFAMFRRDVVEAVGGYSSSTVAEDLDLVVRTHKYLLASGEKYAVPFVPDPVAWTEVPIDAKTLGTQRERWHRGLIVCLWENLGMLFNPRYGKIGMISVPFFFFGEMMAPLVELFGITVSIIGVTQGALNVKAATLFFVACWGYGLVITLASVVIEEVTFRVYPRSRDLLRMMYYACIEPFGYRQMTVIWRARAFYYALVGKKSWGTMKRHGFAKAGA